MSGSGWGPSRMFGNGHIAIPEVQEWLEDPPRCPGVVGSPSQMSRICRKTQPDVQEWSEALPDSRSVRETLPDVRVGGMPSRMSGSGRGPSRMSGNGQEALLDVWEWSEGPPGSPGVVGRPT